MKRPHVTSPGLPLSRNEFVQSFSYENEFDLHENELVGESRFHKNGFPLGLVLTQRQTRTRKWRITLPPARMGCLSILALNFLVPFAQLGQERHFESQVSCPRTQCPGGEGEGGTRSIHDGRVRQNLILRSPQK